MSTGFKPSWFAVTTCRVPNRALAEVSLPVRKTPSHPKRVLKKGNAAPVFAATRPWPGDYYVSWVGLDGYFFPWSPGFDSLFGPTISEVRSFTKRPILITETGISPGAPRPGRIADLFHGAALAAKEGVIGLIWFDYSRIEGHDWRIDGDPAALRAFAMSARIYRSGHA